MQLAEITAWLDNVLRNGDFDDVANNGLQIAGPGADVKKVAFAVDGSVAAVKAAVAEGAQLLVVHHGISWGGGIRRLEGGVYNVVRAAIEGGLALYASHLPLDANREVGNNAGIARKLALGSLKPAFNYHGNLIGFIGVAKKTLKTVIGTTEISVRRGMKVGVCSGGAADFAPEAKALGCELFVSGEASWGDVIAAENVDAKLICAGHYETETFGVSSLAEKMAKELKLKTVFIGRK